MLDTQPRPPSKFSGRFVQEPTVESGVRHHQSPPHVHHAGEPAGSSSSAGLTRRYKATWGAIEQDSMPGTDRQAVQAGYVAATLLGMPQDLVPVAAINGNEASKLQLLHRRVSDGLLRGLETVCEATSRSLGIKFASYLEPSNNSIFNSSSL